jgi:hypothetical protein
MRIIGFKDLGQDSDGNYIDEWILGSGKVVNVKTTPKILNTPIKSVYKGVTRIIDSPTELRWIHIIKKLRKHNVRSNDIGIFEKKYDRYTRKTGVLGFFKEK